MTTLIRPDLFRGTLNPSKVLEDYASMCVVQGRPIPLPLFDQENETTTIMTEHRRIEFALGRQCARAALASFGVPSAALPRASSGAPIWPIGYTGSISHCTDFSCAVAARTTDVIGLGIDVERVQPFESEIVDIVCRRDELQRVSMLTKIQGAGWPNVIFSAKEAVYKCLFPLYEVFLEFSEVSLVFTVDASQSSGRFEVIDLPRCFGDCLNRLRGRWMVAKGVVFAGIAAETSTSNLSGA